MKKYSCVKVANMMWATTNVVKYPNIICKWLGIFAKRHFTFDEAVKAVPKGWRIPTAAEMKRLYFGSRYSFDPQTNEGTFVDYKTGATLTLPTAGHIVYDDKVLVGNGTYGYYWSSTPCGKFYVYGMILTPHGVFPSQHVNKGNKFNVRLIRDGEFETDSKTRR